LGILKKSTSVGQWRSQAWASEVLVTPPKVSPRFPLNKPDPILAILRHSVSGAKTNLKVGGPHARRKRRKIFFGRVHPLLWLYKYN